MGVTLAPALRSTLVAIARFFNETIPKRGAGVAFQTRIGIEAELASRTLVHVPLNDGGSVFSDLGVYVRSSRYLPVAVDAFVRALSEEIAIREAGQDSPSSSTTPQRR